MAVVDTEEDEHSSIVGESVKSAYGNGGGPYYAENASDNRRVCDA